jgi:fumarate reductase flavoprotein subunit
MRSHTVAAEGGAAGVIKDNDSLDNHFHDTVSGGDWLCDQDAVELFVNIAPLELLQMERWGCPWVHWLSHSQLSARLDVGRHSTAP